MANRRSGKRNAAGRHVRDKASLAEAARKSWDYGNDVVQRRRLIWAPIIASIPPEYCVNEQGEIRVLDNTGDAIGQLWALGFFNDHGFDPKALRNTGRGFAAARWAYWGGKLSATYNEPRSRTSSSKEVPPARKADLYFERIDAYVERNTLARKCLLELLVDHDGDDIAPWASRLIGNELMERGRIKFANPLQPDDRTMLNAAIRGLCALVDGAMPMRAAA